jgi:hypothetical protein
LFFIADNLIIGMKRAGNLTSNTIRHSELWL